MDPAVELAAQEAIVQAVTGAPAVAGEPEPTKKKSRWGAKEEEVVPAKKSRWGNTKEEPAPSGGGSAVMHLNPEQVRVQQRLNEIQVCVPRESSHSS